MDYDVTRAWNDLYPHQRRHRKSPPSTPATTCFNVIVAALLSAILVSGVASAQVLRSLALDVHLPEHVFAGRPMLARLLLRNASSCCRRFRARGSAKRKKERTLELGSLYVRLARNPCAPGPVASFPTAVLRRVREEAEKPILRESVYFPFLAPLQELRADLEMSFPTVADTRRKTSAWPRAFPFLS